MAIKKIRMRPEGVNDYTDVLHPETSADVVKFSDGNTVESHKTEFESHKTEFESHKTEFESHKTDKATQTKLGHVKIGKDLQVDNGEVSVDRDFKSAGGSNSIALGRSASAGGGHSTALGNSASAGGSNSTALGRNASAIVNYSTALGNSASAKNIGEGVLGGSATLATNKWIVPGDFTVSGTKNFEMPHPKPSKNATHVIRHGVVETDSQGDNLYRYKIESEKENDVQHIDLPDYFIHLNKDVQIFVTPQGHFGNGYGKLNRETEQLEIHCQSQGGYNVLVIGTRNDDHQSVQDWDIKGVEREIGESWTGETYVFSVDEIMEVEEIKEEIV